MSKRLETLLKKRERLEAEIVAAQSVEKRKNEILALPEFAQILPLPDEVLRREFVRLASKNQPPQ
jgi:hypothetical protein